MLVIWTCTLICDDVFACHNGQVCTFAREFELVPTHCDIADVHFMYSQAYRGHSLDEHVALMGYPEFVEVFTA